MTKTVTLENTRLGGFGLPTGQVVPGNGSITVEPEIWGASKDHPVVKGAVEAGFLIVDGKGRKKPAGDDRDENGDTTEMAAMRQQFNASFATVTTELEAQRGRVGELEQVIADRDAEIAKLKEGGVPAAIKAEHHGGGKFNVTQGETVILSGLSKADADKFNGLSDEEKASFIEKAKS
ncbi:hypothetical protein NGM99_13785 [Mesorhizobium sp. RP14(2022)]|uniref:Uncharacterized protein n=1 Tax=Mesorhizobium liriopis TaxID=2953882 RepID=A0ABT1C7P2_9HYPH|nr:hypothetical protein [Mesorhizobium liriopis]MCO6050850.1 hypothetical protein [Mesorhizobium liriopis]